MKKRTAITAGLVAAALLSLHFSLTFSYLIAERELTLSPARLLAFLLEEGFPVRGFMSLMIPLSAVFILLLAGRPGGASDPYANYVHSDSDVHGSARWLTEGELRGVALVGKAGEVDGPILGKLDERGRKVISLNPSISNRHIAVIGDSGSGKSYCFSRNYCFQAVKARESVILTDPSGELYTSMSNYFRESGYVVKVLNLVDTTQSNGWNCLKEVRRKNESCDIFADTIIRNTQETDRRDFWALGELSLLKALTLRVAFDDTYEENGMQDIGTIFDFLRSEKGEAGIAAAFSNMPENVRDIARGQYNIFRNAGENVSGGIILGLATRLNFLQTQSIRDFLAEDDIDLTLPGERPCAYFCIMPDQNDALKPISSMFFTFLFIDLVDNAMAHGGRLPVTVNLLLDELPNIGAIPGLGGRMATVRKYGINAALIFQSIPRLREAYQSRDAVAGIMDSCATLISYGTNNRETMEYLSEMTGECTTRLTSRREGRLSGAGSPSGSVSVSDGSRMLMTSHDVRTMGNDECLIIFRRKNALRARKFPYTDHPEAAGLTPARLDRIRVPKSPPKGRMVIGREEADETATARTVRKKGLPRGREERE